ncbi:uncharacterized protein Aud_010674 [Aspergillus udagawae]|uniref:Uncharacterized protein n=1 Tax=Aspergillus udagawae TaxID=91492 RepID=A0A8E0QZG5_9EURO|nr:uncharacterized protein Aud_010674 [Aspergillus udagawae]GIC94179.1 hypothetical protein Aud_010674 [Aspergillus udagawae]
MASIGPARCANITGLPELTYPNTCGVPIYQQWNATQDPYTTLGECCHEVNGTIGYFGQESCAAYCNATESTREQLHDCLAQSREINQFGCSGAAVTRGSLWKAVVVMGLTCLREALDLDQSWSPSHVQLIVEDTCASAFAKDNTHVLAVPAAQLTVPIGERVSEGSRVMMDLRDRWVACNTIDDGQSVAVSALYSPNDIYAVALRGDGIQWAERVFIFF